MTKELSSLHSEILSQFKSRLESNEDIPESVVEELAELENLGLESETAVKSAIKEGLRDEAE